MSGFGLSKFWLRQRFGLGKFLVDVKMTNIHHVQKLIMHSFSKEPHTPFSHQIYLCITSLHRSEFRIPRDMFEVLSNGIYDSGRANQTPYKG